MRQLVFRADGNADTGLGHLYRTFALVEMCRGQISHVLLTRASTTTSVIPKDYNVAVMPEIAAGDEPAWLNQHYPPEANSIVTDGYDFGSDYQRKLKDLGYRILSVDDFAREHQFSDVVINHAPGVKESDYEAEPYTRFALGTNYAILRSAFLAAAAKPARVPSTSRKKVFVCFGGADTLDLTAKAAEAMSTFSEVDTITAVTGAAHKGESLERLAAANSRVKWYRNLGETELAVLMSECDLAISSASTILYELCAIKVPTIAGYYVDNQKLLYDGMAATGAIYGIGNIASAHKEDLRSRFSALMQNYDFGPMLSAQARLFDRHIRSRYRRLFYNIRYRKAGGEDMMQLFDWSNDEVTRANSFSSNTISLDEHKKWFQAKITDPLSAVYIALADEEPAGMVRYDVSRDDQRVAVVGIVIGANFRGYGMAGIFLTDTAELCFADHRVEEIHAYIKKENKPSIVSFENAGYVYAGESQVRDQACLLFKRLREPGQGGSAVGKV